MSTSGYQWVQVYQVYEEDQDQISGATYISDVVFPLKESKMAKTRNKFGGKSVHFHKKMKPGGVAETFGKRVAVDLQLCDLNKKTII